jgi:DNA recombination-dependent growth factor C
MTINFTSALDKPSDATLEAQDRAYKLVTRKKERENQRLKQKVNDLTEKEKRMLTKGERNFLKPARKD